MAGGAVSHETADVVARLTAASAAVFEGLPVGIRGELMEDRDPHGNVQVAHIETEKLLIRLVGAELEARAAAGAFAGKFAALPHYFGYEGR